MPAQDATVDVLVEQSGGSCNRYVYDEQAHIVRLAEVLHPPGSRPVDRGIVPNTLTDLGEPLPVVLLVTHHLFPGVRVVSRPLALLDSEDTSLEWIVAVPAVDPSFDGRRDVGDLTDAERQTIEALHPGTRLRWQPASAAIACVRTARERAAWARAEAAKGHFFGRSWQADRLVGSGRVSDVHTPAERNLRALPFRFQRYVADCLFPDERILLFVTRPPMAAAASGLSFLRLRRLPEGLLIVTDRQVLWMVDALPPDATMVHWGYIAQVGALERLSAVAVDHREGHLCLTVTLTARYGSEAVEIAFPNDRRSLVIDAVKLLERFIPHPPTRAVQRIYRITPDTLLSDASERSDESDTDPGRERLRAIVFEALAKDEVTAAMAYVPAGHRRPFARLVMATNHRVIVVEDRPATPVATYRITDLTSVTLRNALVGCSCEFASASSGAIERISIPFDYPQRDAVLEVFSAVRQVLGQPPGVGPLLDVRSVNRR